MIRASPREESDLETLKKNEGNVNYIEFRNSDNKPVEMGLLLRNLEMMKKRNNILGIDIGQDSSFKNLDVLNLFQGIVGLGLEGRHLVDISAISTAEKLKNVTIKPPPNAGNAGMRLQFESNQGNGNYYNFAYVFRPAGRLQRGPDMATKS